MRQDAEDPRMLRERHLSQNEIVEGNAGHQHRGLYKGTSWEWCGLSSRGRFVNSLGYRIFTLCAPLHKEGNGLEVFFGGGVSDPLGVGWLGCSRRGKRHWRRRQALHLGARVGFSDSRDH